MFCSTCGEQLQIIFAFCPKCGKGIPNQEKDEVPHVNKKVVESFNSFKERKETERAQYFRPKSSKFKREARKTREDLSEKVRVNVGIMMYDGCELKSLRGKGVVLTVSKSCRKEELLKTAVEKHTAHSKDIINAQSKFTLLYPDGTEVEKLKEKDEDFVLYKYKSEFGKAYHRINFFLCSALDFSQATLGQCLNNVSDSLESSDETEEPSKKLKADREGGKETDDDDLPIMIKSIKAAASTMSQPSTSVSELPACTSQPSTSTSQPSTSQPSTTTSQPSTSTSLPCSSTCSLSYSDINSRVQHKQKLETMTEMFPHIHSEVICDALSQADYNMDIAISYLLENGTFETSPQQVYASLAFCNDVADDLEFCMAAIQDNWNNDSPVIEETKEPISTLISILAAEKLRKDKPVRIKVRRSSIWEDTKMKMKKCSSADLVNVIKVQFVGEPAVDAGVPRNEFFSLLNKELCNSSLFIGEANRKCFNHDLLALEQREFYMYGQLCSMAIMQGSPSPCFFAPAIADYIVFGEIEKVETSIQDVSNPKVRRQLEELEKIEDPETFKRVASFECSFRFKTGFNKPVVTITDKEKLFHAVALHHTLLSSLSEVNQFVDGLRLNGLLDCLRQHPRKARNMFLHSENQLTAEQLDDLITPMFSPQGSNRRTPEEAISVNLSRYLEDVECGQVTSKVVDFSTDEESEVMVTLGTVLQFITGSPLIPPLGFDSKPAVRFLHDDPDRKMNANTCSCTLTLPVNKLLLEYNSFKTEFTSCLIESPGFGNV